MGYIETLCQKKTVLEKILKAQFPPPYFCSTLWAISVLFWQKRINKPSKHEALSSDLSTEKKTMIKLRSLHKLQSLDTSAPESSSMRN
jgi:hypothetical protein